MYRSIIQYYLGIKPAEKGILILPCTQKSWRAAKITFNIRGGQYDLEILNPELKPLNSLKNIFLDGRKLKGDVIPYLRGRHRIKVVYESRT